MNRAALSGWAGLGMVAVLLLSACGEGGAIEAFPAQAPSILEPRGPGAAGIARLWWWLLGLGTLVLLAVCVLVAVAVRRPAPRSRLRGLIGTDQRFVAWWGIAIPAVILTALLGMNVHYGALAYRPPESAVATAAVEIRIVGHQFWWEVRYHVDGSDGERVVVDANELHLPVGEPVRLLLEAHDVIHTFWVPELHGKMDLIPGRTNEFWIQADEPGVYRGICAEYCGIQHAQMHFLAVAHPPGNFAEWIDARLEEPAALDGLAAAGADVFTGMGCAACHTVRGVSPDSDAAPDLTNLAHRLTIAAGMQPNTPDRLRGWILDPQHAKPGARMPATALTPEQLDALLAFFSAVAPDGTGPDRGGPDGAGGGPDGAGG